MKPPVFLLASERSGTNLLRRRLTEHQRDYFGPAPLHLLKHLYWAEPYYGSLKKEENFEEFVKDALGLAYHHFSPWDEEINVEQVKIKYEDFFPSGYRSAIGVMHVIYMIYAQRKGYSSYFCKDNNLFDFVADIKLEVPDAKFIYLYRDPRDVVASQMKRPLQVKSVLCLAELWRKEQVKCIRHVTSLEGKKDIITFSYEKFIENEDECIEKMCAFLNVVMVGQEDGFLSKEVTKIQEWENLDKPTMKGNSKKFSQSLSSKQVKKIEAICWRQMLWLGYEPVFNERASISNKHIRLESLLANLEKVFFSRFRKSGITTEQYDRLKYTSEIKRKWQ